MKCAAVSSVRETGNSGKHKRDHAERAGAGAGKPFSFPQMEKNKKQTKSKTPRFRVKD